MSLVLTVITASVICWNPTHASTDCSVSSAKPVVVPYLDKTINEVRGINEFQSRVSFRTESDYADADHPEPGRDPEADEHATGALLKLVGEITDKESTGASGNGTDPVLTDLGAWTITFYCPCAECCGPWATGCTASEVAATPWHTIATDQFDFGTEIYIEGLGYFVVEDRGVEGAWIDVFVSNHQEALDLGMQTREVYLVENGTQIH